MALVRQILLRLESTDEENLQARDLGLGDYETSIVERHLELMQEAALIDAEVIHSTGGLHVIVHRITWDGYDFLDAARNDRVWSRAMARIKDEGMTVSFDILKTLLSRIVSAAVLE